VSPKNTYEKLGIQMETYEFCEKHSLVMYINYGQDMNNYGFFLAKIHTDGDKTKSSVKCRKGSSWKKCRQVAIF
jgi:hypothetical protein